MTDDDRDAVIEEDPLQALIEELQPRSAVAEDINRGLRLMREAHAAATRTVLTIRCPKAARRDRPLFTVEETPHGLLFVATRPMPAVTRTIVERDVARAKAAGHERPNLLPAFSENLVLLEQPAPDSWQGTLAPECPRHGQFHLDRRVVLKAARSGDIVELLQDVCPTSAD